MFITFILASPLPVDAGYVDTNTNWQFRIIFWILTSLCLLQEARNLKYYLIGILNKFVPLIMIGSIEYTKLQFFSLDLYPELTLPIFELFVDKKWEFFYISKQ